ncbi:hypothetical protein EDE08_102522 [Bradyrhizobium sp. R2.2-H]|jgi:hypothetical protein|uniref:hypothetical protein n=1 Tax=unclassified Bradyrhizobium TaxID=2631580 RepID=UPI00104324F2|nr:MULTISPECIES: hypothetical protein [unclassified Bradyrhizobium]TCU76979.1 hypothetical protein EDE10_102522 [Bradyrhizobium sp. Y-H1]TCU80052.1 hypothetical protein EDE08_102522 [Bradyrhizobium sp. R2.2-H]
MPQIASSLAIAIGVLVAALTAIDWFLLKHHKEWIRGKASTLWIWLSYQQALPMLRHIESNRTFVGAAILGFCLPIVGNVLLLILLEVDPTFAVTFLIVGTIGCGVLFLIFRGVIFAIWNRLFTDGQTGKYILRAIVCAAISFGAAFLLSEILADQIEKASRRPLFEGLWFLLIAMIGDYIAVTLAWMAVVVLLYAAFIYSLIVCYKILQFITLRIVEKENGPVLALAGLLTALGAIAKALMPASP